MFMTNSYHKIATWWLNISPGLVEKDYSSMQMLNDARQEKCKTSMELFDVLNENMTKLSF